MEARSSHGDRAGGVKRNRTAVSVELKQAVCEYAQKHPAESQTAVATWFSQNYNKHPPIQRCTIGNILERKDEFLETDENHPSLKRAILRNPKWPVLDSVLFQRFQQLKGKDGGDLQLSNGWMSNWKRRHKVHCVKLCGESGSAPAENVELSRSALPKIIEQYDPKDCFIGDESGWFYRQTVAPCRKSKSLQN
ncbi:hypothetical protein EMCRGX_G017455 [Ephydatia muelleri]